MFRGHQRAKAIADKNWDRRRKAMPGLQETFDLIRQICAGNSSFLGTCVTSLEMIRTDIREIRMCQARMEDTVDALAKRVMIMNATLTTFLGAADDDTTPSRLPAD